MIKIQVAADGEPLLIELPGLQAVVVDPRRGVVALDGISGTVTSAERIEWQMFDLRDGTYGDFHRLTPGESCADRNCYRGGEHVLGDGPAGDDEPEWGSADSNAHQAGQERARDMAAEDGDYDTCEPAL